MSAEEVEAKIKEFNVASRLEKVLATISLEGNNLDS